MDTLEDHGHAITIQLQHVEVGDTIPSHDGLIHDVEGWTELPSGGIVLAIIKSDGERYTFYGRPGSEIQVVA